MHFRQGFFLISKRYMLSYKTMVWILSVTLIIITVFVIFLLMFTSKGQYLLRRIKAFPQGIQYTNISEKYQFMAENGYHTDVVMFGNSITYEGQWNELLPEIKIANRGIPGDRIEGMLRRLPTIEALKPSKIVVMAGVNNLLQNEMADDVARKYIQLIDSASKFAEVIICSTLLTETYPYVNGQIEELNEYISKYCSEKGIRWIDLNCHLAPGGNLRRQFTYDGLHLTNEAYAIWTQELLPYLTK